jgi:hypothetical protein
LSEPGGGQHMGCERAALSRGFSPGTDSSQLRRCDAHALLRSGGAWSWNAASCQFSKRVAVAVAATLLQAVGSYCSVRQPMLRARHIRRSRARTSSIPRSPDLSTRTSTPDRCPARLARNLQRTWRTTASGGRASHGGSCADSPLERPTRLALGASVAVPGTGRRVVDEGSER